MQRRSEARPDSYGSRTLTLNATRRSHENEPSTDGDHSVGVLHLRANQSNEQRDNAASSSSQNGRRVMWTSDTIDNEGLGKKKSKSKLHADTVCCIYHKPRAFDESSSESSGDESDDSISSVPDSSDDDGAARPTQSRRVCRGPTCSHKDHAHSHATKRNAYERA